MGIGHLTHPSRRRLAQSSCLAVWSKVGRALIPTGRMLGWVTQWVLTQRTLGNSCHLVEPARRHRYPEMGSNLAKSPAVGLVRPGWKKKWFCSPGRGKELPLQRHAWVPTWGWGLCLEVALATFWPPLCAWASGSHVPPSSIFESEF